MKKYFSHCSLRMDKELSKKLKYVAAYDGRSKNATLVRLAHAYINKFEKEHGRIPDIAEKDT